MTYSSMRSLPRRNLVRKTRIVIPTRTFFTAANPGPFEEERSLDYSPKSYYPARIGEKLRGKYQLVSKLGWGTGSTVWLAKTSSWFPWQKDQYVALKITNNTPAVQAAARRELNITNKILAANTSHPGCQFIRRVLDSFEVRGPDGTHIVLALEPLRQPLSLMAQQDGLVGRVPTHTVKAVLPSILQSLDYLHSEADLKGDHFMVPFEDSSVLDQYALRQAANPASHIRRNGRPLYASRSSFGPLRGRVENVKLTDFGLAADGNRPHNHDIQPREYTAPEVILKAGWSYSADIWNLGLVLFDLVGGVNLLSGRVPGHATFSNKTRFGQMTRLLGPVPSELVARADKRACSKYFTDSGDFRYPKLIPDEAFTFENKMAALEGRERELFINFAKRMLAWVPEERATAKELIKDPWLKFECCENEQA
ncbi:hypothetical protein F66182_7857 [Fusarium sp. NRRL 66182]|nr:hypothetical protein F66182_7857 [Fusarium sp. NRRL 66182]